MYDILRKPTLQTTYYDYNGGFPYDDDIADFLSAFISDNERKAVRLG